MSTWPTQRRAPWLLYVIVAATLAGLIFVVQGCAGPDEAESLVAFLKQYDLQVEGEPTHFPVTVPASWEVPLGAYPEGLYWGLANELSRDVGLDLTALKGQQVEAWVYSLAGGLPGEGEQSQFHYPTNVVLLVRNGKVSGAWLQFNVMSIGLSLKKRSLQDITGLSFEQWLERKGYFTDAGTNTDLAGLGPVAVINAFFDAINNGDMVRANACLGPRQMLDALTVNLLPNRLYNPGFGANNSLAANIESGRLLSWSFVT